MSSGAESRPMPLVSHRLATTIKTQLHPNIAAERMVDQSNNTSRMLSWCPAPAPYQFRALPHHHTCRSDKSTALLGLPSHWWRALDQYHRWQQPPCRAVVLVINPQMGSENRGGNQPGCEKKGRRAINPTFPCEVWVFLSPSVSLCT